MERAHLIRVLGPIDVVMPTGKVAVGGPQVRAVLAILALSAGRAISIDHLEHALWGATPPNSADNTLQSYVSHLRQILGADVVVNVDHSYELDTRADNIDALFFEDLLTRATDLRADPEQCSELSNEALNLWRGPPFGDLADEQPFRLQTYRLNELRLAAMELNIEADLALGRHGLVIGKLETAVEENPYRERLWYLLVEALARSGRRVESLRACTRLRNILAEAGIEGANALMSLEQRILEAETFPTNDRIAPLDQVLWFAPTRHRPCSTRGTREGTNG